jgi:hypothetical protein
MAKEASIDSDDLSFEHVQHLDRVLNSVNGKDDKRWSLGPDSRTFWRLNRFMRAVVYGDKPAFKIQQGKRGKVAVHESSPAQYFRSMLSFVPLFSNDLSYAPHLQLFFDCFKKHGIQACSMQNENRIAVNDESEAEVFNDFIDFIRKEGDWIDVKKKIADWERNATENKKRIRSYMNALFDKYARLLVLRIDLGYKVAVLTEEEIKEAHDQLLAMAWQAEVTLFAEKVETDEIKAVARVGIAEAMKDREHLFENMRSKPSLFKHLVGFMWSIEYSRAGGYHLHCAFFFDGSEVQKHEWLADQIGAYWVNVVTKERGVYYNCNRGSYKYYAVGPVDYHDDVKRTHLMKTLEYLAKKDQLVYVKPTVKCKLFGTGRMPALKSGAGRPRKK